MKIDKDERLPVFFNKEEYEKVEQAAQQSSVLGINQFVRVLVHTGLEKIDMNGKEITLKFDVTQSYKDLTRYKAVMIKTTDRDYEKIMKIVDVIPFRVSLFLKYLVMQQISKILEEGK